MLAIGTFFSEVAIKEESGVQKSTTSSVQSQGIQWASQPPQVAHLRVNPPAILAPSLS